MKWDKLVDTFGAAHEVLVRLPSRTVRETSQIFTSRLSYGRLANDGTKLYLLTNQDAPRYKVVALDLADESRERAVIIPECKSAHLEDVLAVNNDTLAVIYKRNVSLIFMLSTFALY